MDNFLLVAVVLSAAGAAGWFYWQSQKAEQRMTEMAAQLAVQAALVGEMVDEVFAAGQHLYQEMDRWQAQMDNALAQPTPAEKTEPTAAAEDAAPEALPETAAYSPHLHALRLAMGGCDPIEIARQTGIGLEELRLLLRFQEAGEGRRTADR